MNDVNKSILQGAQEALDYARGNKTGSKTYQFVVPDEIDVKGIRKKLNMTRQEFAGTFAIKLRTLEKWERGERLPEGPARAYLLIIASHPMTVIDTLKKHHNNQ